MANSKRRSQMVGQLRVKETSQMGFGIKMSNSCINELEQLAAFFALKCFASEKKNCELLLRINTIQRRSPTSIRWEVYAMQTSTKSLKTYGNGANHVTFGPSPPTFHPRRTQRQTQNQEKLTSIQSGNLKTQLLKKLCSVSAHRKSTFLLQELTGKLTYSVLGIEIQKRS